MSGKVKWAVPMEEALLAVAALQEAAENEERTLSILDVGGAMKPLAIATHLMDMLPYDNRAWSGYIPGEAIRSMERFTQETWFEQDLHDFPWPFADDEFDVIWCTQTVEDLRDPIGVIKEMCRVGKIGYIETIHRAFESLKNVDHPDFAGWMHHRWLIEPDGDRLKFMFKFPQLHVVPETTPDGIGIRNLSVWWTGEIEAYEYIPLSANEINNNLLDYAESTRQTVAP